MTDAAVKPATDTRIRKRHWYLMASFFFVVLVPIIMAGFYLYKIASDQYSSTMGFSVRKEEFTSPIELFGGITDLSGSDGSDVDILYKYLQSQELVERLHAQLNLVHLFSKPENDPIFAFNPSGSIEDLLSYWNWVSRTELDQGSGLLEFRILAFTAEDAREISTAVLAESSRLINDLSATAREDTTRYAADELNRAVERLKSARNKVTEFRSRTQIVDPITDLQGQLGLLNNLEQQLAEALIAVSVLRDTTKKKDIRVTQADRRIEIIKNLIYEERNNFGVGTDPRSSAKDDYATLIAEFESLSIDLEFAEQAYIAALASLDAARAEARRKNRYLAAFIRPTLAEKAQYPNRILLLGSIAMFSLLAWSIGALVFYSIRDRR